MDFLPKSHGRCDKKLIFAYKNGENFYQGSGDAVPIINCLYGSSRSPKLIGPANDIQKRIAKDLCQNESLLYGLHEEYKKLITGLSPQQLERFKLVFMTYINGVMDDLGKYPDYKTILFPFSSEGPVLELNKYLSKEFNAIKLRHNPL